MKKHHSEPMMEYCKFFDTEDEAIASCREVNQRLIEMEENGAREGMGVIGIGEGFMRAQRLAKMPGDDFERSGPIIVTLDSANANAGCIE